MPKSLREIFDHADEYAQRFEAYEPEPGDLRAPERDRISQLVRTRAEVDPSIVEAVKQARGAGGPGLRSARNWAPVEKRRGSGTRT